MLPVLTAARMREADRYTIETLGVPGVVLMENAGAAVAAALGRHFPARRPAVLCGKGNNGGDGFVVARRLLGQRPLVLLLGAREEVKGDARTHLEALLSSGGAVQEVSDALAWEAARSAVLGCGVLVDALLGTGLRQAPAGLIGTVIAELAARETPPVVAVDVPSGLPSDSGHCDWPVVPAALTVTFAAPKHGHVLSPACRSVGRLEVAEIGIPREAVADQADLWLIEDADAAAAFPPRSPGAHKGDFGHLLILAGSPGKTGAAALAAEAALRAGCGLVTVATSDAARTLLVSQARAEVMTEVLPGTASGALAAGALDAALTLAGTRSAVLLGPGLGEDPGTREFVRAFVKRCDRPLAIDADGLNALAGDPDRIASGETATVLTPHPGEMARLLGSTSARVQAARLDAVRDLAARARAHVLLKGERTLLAAPDGQAAVAPSGNPGMATAGTGDVLAGVVGALLARGCDAWQAAMAGVHVHGLAGDRAAARLGQESLLAGDLSAALPEVLLALTGSA